MKPQEFRLNHYERKPGVDAGSRPWDDGGGWHPDPKMGGGRLGPSPGYATGGGVAVKTRRYHTPPMEGFWFQLLSHPTPMEI